MTVPSHEHADTPDAIDARAPIERLSHGEASELARQIAGLAGAGLPLPSGLRALGDELQAGPLRTSLRLLADDLEAGMPLEQAVEDLGHRLPPHVRGLILAASRSGRLSEVLGEFVAYQDVGTKIRRTLWISLLYPMALVLTSLVLFVFLSLVAAREFGSIFRDFGVNLPVLTVHMLAVAEGIASVGWWLLIGPILTIVVAWLMARMLFRADERRRFLHSVPLFGPLWRWSAMAEFCQILSLLVDAEMPLPEAVGLAGASTQDAALTTTCNEVAGDLERGEDLANALARHHIFPEGFARFLEWAQSSRSMGEALRLAGEMFETQARSQARLIARLGTVLSVVLVLWWTTLVVIALFWPMMRFITLLAFCLL